jgi:hypothetical protein
VELESTGKILVKVPDQVGYQVSIIVKVVLELVHLEDHMVKVYKVESVQ